ncbi:metal ABC transporter ATP-binding protein [Nocardia aurantia]|uniref:Vitamin B12 import ATP-binding protein BtuD n=1 Tax=Nocardia aurantia TaxID=2585199 RepID=A0A7K0DG54_9NOCA|nr:ABC transporter ATP-binding protein [Nocardia aurantia]MQY24800.1 Vitamin B12 import ATP-binding protein BtuD [Nocardia aurantia]
MAIAQANAMAAGATVPAAGSGEPPVVRLRDAATARGGRRIWSDVSLEVRPGEFVAVLGPNGAGKSTLLDVLLGLVPVVAGSAEVLGERPGRRNPRIGYLPQRRAFDTAVRLRGADVVRLGLDGTRWGTPLPILFPRRRRARRQRLHEVLARVGASGYADRPIGRCSGGEQQRLLIAQALIRRPALLLLDEPLDSLDLPGQAGIITLIRDLCRTDGVTVLMVAHDVNPLLPHLDRVIYLAGGAAATGTPAEVITPRRLTALHGIPIEVLHDSAGLPVVVGRPGTPSGPSSSDPGVPR